MANVYAVKNGNWSDTTVWNTGALPTTADDVYPNNFTVTVNQNITVLSLRNGASSPIVAGGTFALANGIMVTVTADIGFNPAAGTLTRITGSDSATINGNIGGDLAGTSLLISQSANITISGSVTGNTSTGANSITHASSGILIITGSVRGGRGTNTHGISNTSSGSIYVTGSVTGGSALTALGINNVGANSTTIIIGNVSSGIGSGANGIAQFGSNSILNITGSVIANVAPAIQANSAGCSIYISGSVVGGRTDTVGAVYKTTTGILQIIGPITAGQVAPGVVTNANPSPIYLTGPFYNTNNRNAVYAPIIQLISGSTPTWTFDTETVLEQRTLYPLNYPGNFPATNNVRQGVTFGDTGQFSGTIAMPNASDVFKGVPINNTTGSASFDTQSVWSVATSSLTSSNSVGARLSNTATVSTDANLITSNGTI
jgi:hypothetical protein